MNQHKFSGVKGNFLQRRYGVSLGRRYVIAAARVVLLGVLGYSQVDGSRNVLDQSPLPGTESPSPKDTSN